MTEAPSPRASPVTERDIAETRRLNNELRQHGRGGVVAVSLSLVAAGESAVVTVLKAIAAQALSSNGLNDFGRAGGFVWAVVSSVDGTRILAVWLPSDNDAAIDMVIDPILIR